MTTLFDALASTSPGPVHSGDPETARYAATDAARRAPILRERALVELGAAGDGGLTDWELSLRLGGCLRTTAGKRRGELAALGLVVDSGGRRPTDTGSSAVVWIATPGGRALAAALAPSVEVLSVNGASGAGAPEKQEAPVRAGASRESAVD